MLLLLALCLSSLTCRRSPPPRARWLVEAERLLDEEHQPAAAEALLLSRLRAGGLKPEERAAALGLVGFIAMEDYRDAEALDRLRQAIQADKEAAQPEEEAEHLLELTSLMAQHLNQFTEADALLMRDQPLLQRFPSLDAYALVQRALNQREQGNMAEVFPLLDQAAQRAQQAGEAASLHGEIAKQRAWTLVLLGRIAEAKEIFAPATALPKTGAETDAALKKRSCLRGRMLSTQGYLWSRVREAINPAHPQWSVVDPYPALSEAETLLSRCGLTGSHGNVLANLAHAALAAGRPAEASEALKKARVVMPHPNADQRLEREEIEGSIALAERRHADAAAHFQRIEREIGRRGSPRSSQELGWRSLFGQAQARAPSDPKAALVLYQKAERYLDDRSLELPLGNGRGTFLGLYERGTTAYVDLLVQQGRLEEAVQTIRHARARGLRGLEVLSLVDRLPPERRADWERDLSGYAQARKELDDLAARADDAPESERAAWAQQVQRGQGRLLERLQRALTRIGAQPRAASFDPPRPDEALLLCYPRAAPPGQPIPGWRCYAQDTQGVAMTDIAQMREPELAQAVKALSSRLARAGRVRVVAYGDMRSVDLLPEATALLKDVAYALDLPWRRSAVARAEGAGRPPRALVIYSPQGNTPATRRAGQLAVKELRAAGWEVQEQSFTRLGSYAGKPQSGPPLVGEQLRQELGRADLFLYLGVGLFAPSGGWSHRLKTLDDAGLLVSDFLALPHVPRFALLFGCETGQSGEETGGLEGLGLSQSLVLKGSAWTIGTVRVIMDEVAEAMTAALLAQSRQDRAGAARGILGAAPDPVALLRDAQRGALAQPCLAQLLSTKRTAVERDLAAFRVFVP